MRKIFLFIILLSIGFPVTWLLIPQKQSKDISIQPLPNNPLSMKGLSYKVYDHGKLLLKVEANELKIAPRNFFIFNINSVNELILTDVKAELYDDMDFKDNKSEEDKGIDLFNSIIEEAINKGKGTELITRAIIRGMDVNIYNSGLLRLKLKAPSAEIKQKERETVFYNATLEHPHTGRLINAAEIFWNGQKRAFLIPGLYEASSPKGKARAKGLIVDLNFNLEAIQNKDFFYLTNHKRSHNKDASTGPPSDK